jgi:phosphate transport system substrate-binding protein
VNGTVDASTQFATQSEDDNVLVTGVAGDANAIGYFGFAYYVENKDKLKAVQIDGGSGCVEPTDATINDGTYKPLSRPLFIYPNTAKSKSNPALAAYVSFYLANAAKLSAEVGYVPVPDTVAQQQLQNWTTAVPQ